MTKSHSLGANRILKVSFFKENIITAMQTVSPLLFKQDDIHSIFKVTKELSINSPKSQYIEGCVVNGWRVHAVGERHAFRFHRFRVQAADA